MAWNFFFDTRGDEEVFWETLTEKIREDTLQKIVNDSEVISHSGCSGEIIDSGKKSFTVNRSVVHEIYQYQEESFIYLRILDETDPLTGKSWISLD